MNRRTFFAALAALPGAIKSLADGDARIARNCFGKGNSGTKSSCLSAHWFQSTRIIRHESSAYTAAIDRIFREKGSAVKYLEGFRQ